MSDPIHLSNQLKLLEWIDYKRHMANWRELVRLNRNMVNEDNTLHRFGKTIIANVSQTLHIGSTLQANRE